MSKFYHDYHSQKKTRERKIVNRRKRIQPKRMIAQILQRNIDIWFMRFMGMSNA